MENRNTVIALLLIMLVWFGYMALFPPVPQQEVAVESPSPVAQEKAALSESTPASSGSSGRQVPGPLAAGSAEEERVVETDQFIFVLSSHGGRVKELRLKNFPETPDEGSPLVSLVARGPSRFANFRTTGSEGFALSGDAPYRFDGPAEKIVLSGKEEGSVTLVTLLDSGIVLEKTFYFSGDRYDFGYSLRAVNRGESRVEGALELSLLHPWDDDMEGSYHEFVGPAAYASGKLEQVSVKDLREKAESFSGSVSWTGFETKYFLTALAPQEGALDKVRLEAREGSVENHLLTPHLSLAPGESLELRFVGFAGPKELEILQEVGHDLEQAIDFGWFALIARPLLWVIKFFYTFLGNYGLSIILVTVIIKMLFWPLTQKSYKAMKDMQRLQPEMQKLREKFKNDKERLNRELMSFYKDHRVNPLGGCLPMVVQIPVFFALYKVLLFAIELRHAPFAFWITDLSAKDPYYITPLIMGATMFIQQKMTPTTMDPAQAKIFMIMPVVFTVLFLNFPSGLVLYWLVNNILTIAQQMLVNRTVPAKG